MNTNDYKIWENPEEINIKIIKREKLSEGKWLNSESITYERNGFVKKWEMIKRDACDGVIAVLPVTEEGNIILIEEVRVPTIENGSEGRIIGMPAGLVDIGDSKEKTVNKELAEETGFKTNKIEYVKSVYSSEGMTNEKVDVFIAYSCTKIFEIIEGYKEVNGQIIKHDSGENITAMYSVPYQEIDDFLEEMDKKGINSGSKIDCALRKLEKNIRNNK